MDRQAKRIEEIKEASQRLKLNQEKDEISEKERDQIRAQAQRIKQFSDGLQDKLNMFSNKLVLCRSDIEIFSENTRK